MDVETLPLPFWWRSAAADRHLGSVLFHRHAERAHSEIGRASCRERVEISVVAVSLKKKIDIAGGRNAAAIRACCIARPIKYYGLVRRLEGRVGTTGNRSKKLGGILLLFFSSRRRHTRLQGDWSSDVCSSD